MGVRRVYLDIVLVVIICHFLCVWGEDATLSTNTAYVGETVTIDCPMKGSFTYPAWVGPPGGVTYTNGQGAAINPLADRVRFAPNMQDLIRMNVTTADGGDYQCSGNIGGVLTLGIHTLHVRVLPGLPEITGSGVVSGTEGQPLTLTCVCRGGFPAPTLAWYRNTVTQGTIKNTTTPSDRSATSVTVTFTFTPGSDDDKINYICQSSFHDPQPEPINRTSVQLYLNLKPSPPIVQQNRDGTAGSTNAILQCDTSGFRPQNITISWKYKETGYGGNPQIESDGDKYRATSTLELPVLRADNRGSVECNVTHSPTLSSLTESIAMNVLFPPVSATVSGETQTVADGTTPLTLSCTVGDANPAVSSFSWTGPGVVGKTAQDVELSPTRDQDRANITCTAKNTVGSVTSPSVMLDLTYHPITTIAEGTSITKTEGDVGLVLHCSTDSKPVSTIIWLHNNNQVMDGTHNNQLNYSVGTVNRADAGMYTCKANNGITGTTSDTEKSVTLAVLFAPDSVAVTGNKPIVATGTTSLTSLTSLTLKCTVGVANPAVSYSWIGPGGVRAMTTQTVTLRPTRDQDGANVTCTATNTVGSVTSPSVMLELTYHPITTISDGTSITKTEGDVALVLHCSTDSKPTSNIIWYHDGKLVSQGQNNNELNYVVCTVNRTDTGTYTCRADNGITGTTTDREKSVTLAVLYPPDVTATGPDRTVNDTSVTITCSASGVPGSYSYYPWYYTWSNGHVSSHKLDLADTQPLTVTNLTYQHSGIYTCRVSNGIAPYGTPAAHIREGSTSVITIKSNPVIIDKVDKVTTQLHQPTNFNITYYSNAGIPTVSCHRVFNNGTESVSVGNVTTETAVIQLPMLDNSTVPVNGTRATVNLTIDDESELGFHQVKLRNTIGTAIVDLQIQSIGRPEPPQNASVSGFSTTSVNVSWNLGFHGGLDQTFVVQYSTNGVAWTNGTTLYTGRSVSRDRHHVSVDSLSPGQLYYLRIYAYNEMGRAYTDNFSVTTSTQVTDGESSASTYIGPIVGGLVAVLVVIAVVVGVVVLYKKGYRINIKRPGNKRDKYSAHVYENEFGTDKRKPPNGARQVPATLATKDNGSPIRASAGTGSGPIYDEPDADPQAGAESRDESITASYEMLERRQSENRTYDELRLPAPPEYENLRIP